MIKNLSEEKRNSIITFFRQAVLDSESDTDYLYRCYGIIQDFAATKGLEFNGYFNSKYKQALANPVSFDEDYFDNQDRINLYVFKCAEIDEEIFGLLKSVYSLISYDLTKNDLDREIFILEEGGIRF